MGENCGYLEKMFPEISAGVEYKNIEFLIASKIVKTVTPTIKIKKNDYKTDGKTPIVSQEIEYISGYSDFEDKNIVKNNYVCFGDHSEHIKFVDFSFVQGADGLKIMLLNEHKIIAKYFFYAISNFYKRHNNYERHFKYLQATEIPVPPLAVQEEVVRVLDKFTQLQTELQTELRLRKKQYEYYRDKLLTFGDEVEWKTLGEVATIDRGGNFQKADFIENGRPCIHYGQLYTHFRTYADKTLTFVSEEVFNKSKIANPQNIVMAVTSENVDDVCKCVAWLGKENIAVSGHTAIIRHNQNAKFLAYYFQSSSFYKEKIKLAHGTKVIEVTPSKMANIKIPIPPLAEQERIVGILDKFESLCQDLTAGIPAEIAARQKQYEYYRDLLLTFKRKDEK